VGYISGAFLHQHVAGGGVHPEAGVWEELGEAVAVAGW